MIKPTRYNIILFVLLCAALFPFLALSFFNYPSADDLIYSYVAKQSSVFHNVTDAYLHWSGRYFSSFIISLNPLVFGWEFGYTLFPIILIALLYLGLLLLVNSFIKIHFINRHLEALILLVLIIQIFPSPVEAFYWISGSLAYTLPYIILFLFIYLLQKQTQNKISLIVIGLLAIILSGTNEIMMLLVFETLLLLLIFKTIHKKPNVKLLVAFIGLVAGIIIELSAPGNYRRLEFFPLHGQIPESLVSSAFSFFRIGVHTLSQPSLWLVILIVFILGAQKNFQISETLNQKRNIIFLSVISILIAASLYFPAYFAMGIAPPPRIHNCVSIALVLILIINSAVWGNYYGINHSSVIQSTPKIITQMLIILTVLLLFTGFQKRPGESISFSGNVTNAWNDLLFKAVPYKKEMNERLQKVSRAQQLNQDTLLLNPIISKPYTTFYIDIKENPDHWINISFSEYYHLKCVKLQKEKP